MHEIPWLREMIENEDLLPLFTSDNEDLHKTIADIMDLANRKKDVERELIHLLEVAATHGNDDTQGALWIMLILGETQSRESIFTLINALKSPDEALQEGASDAIQRIGEPAFEALMESCAGTPPTEFDQISLATLTGAIAWEHPYLLDEVRDFIVEKIGNEDLPQRSLESAALASAMLGDRRALPVLQSLLKARYGGVNAALQDAIGMLEDNPEGAPIPKQIVTWEDRVSQLTEHLF